MVAFELTGLTQKSNHDNDRLLYVQHLEACTSIVTRCRIDAYHKEPNSGKIAIQEKNGGSKTVRSSLPNGTNLCGQGEDITINR